MQVRIRQFEDLAFQSAVNNSWTWTKISFRHEDVYVKLLTELNWKRLAALTEDGMKYTQYITDMESKLRDNHIDLIVNKKFARESNKEKQLENFKTVNTLVDVINRRLKTISNILTISQRYFTCQLTVSPLSFISSRSKSWRRFTEPKSLLQTFTTTLWWSW